MRKNSILTVAAFAAVVTLAPSLIAGDCAAKKSASASTCTAGQDRPGAEREAQGV